MFAAASAIRVPRPDLQSAPTPCLWNGCPLLLWHVGAHAPAAGDVRCLPIVEKRGDRVVYWNVRAEADGEGGQHVEVAPRRWIRLFGSQQGVAFDRVFIAGDEAAYLGESQPHTGELTIIGTEWVSVCDAGTVATLSIANFLIRNRPCARADLLATLGRS